MAVILVIPNAGLDQLIASPVLLAQMWPGACDEVKMLIQVLRMSFPSLAQVLAVGLITILGPWAEDSPRIALGYGNAVLSAVAFSEADDLVAAPHLQPGSVLRLEVADLSVGGQSGLRLAG
jgi:hypothetical protein